MPSLSLAPSLHGFGLGAGLIIAIGAQNAFVLRQGLKRIYPFTTAAICSLCDATLIVLGVAGLGTLLSRNSLLTTLATWGGALFLLLYGLRAFRSAAAPGTLSIQDAGARPATARGTVMAALAFSLLNPHVYLDTVILLGSLGAQFPAGERIAFAAGATFASTIWFFGLVYGATWLAPLFQRPAAWRVLDGLVGCVMWLIALSLILSDLVPPAPGSGGPAPQNGVEAVRQVAGGDGIEAAGDFSRVAVQWLGEDAQDGAIGAQAAHLEEAALDDRAGRSWLLDRLAIQLGVDRADEPGGQLFRTGLCHGHCEAGLDLGRTRNAARPLEVLRDKHVIGMLVADDGFPYDFHPARGRILP
ncbi:MAG TPA: LysE/ArgO family amino acid transporter [Ardenticatenaceae bacterium]|nr:LysE/ArgO family amino acid transporter [Ardenticatenaceae bacterium]